MSSKPCLGYHSRTDAVLGLRAQGLNSASIAAKIGIEVKTVTALENSARRSKVRGPREFRFSPSTAKEQTVTIDNDVLIALRPYAARRSISVNALIRQLVSIMAGDDLVDALLDDDAETQR